MPGIPLSGSLVLNQCCLQLEIVADPEWFPLLRSFMMEYDVHTVLDMMALVATGWVIYTLRFRLMDTYQDDQDSVKTYYVVRG